MARTKTNTQNATKTRKDTMTQETFRKKTIFVFSGFLLFIFSNFNTSNYIIYFILNKSLCNRIIRPRLFRKLTWIAMSTLQLNVVLLMLFQFCIIYNDTFPLLHVFQIAMQTPPVVTDCITYTISTDKNVGTYLQTHAFQMYTQLEHNIIKNV